MTIVTSGEEESRTGLTVSSLMVGGDVDTGRVHFVVGPDSYVRDAIERTQRFIVHVLDVAHRELSDRFAGIRPSPGGPFAGIAWSPSPYGPLLDDVANRALCSVEGMTAYEGYVLVTGGIDDTHLSDLEPLHWFRGSYGSRPRR